MDKLLGWLTDRRDGAVAVVLTFALVVPLTVAAIRADGFDRSKVNLHDAGVWVVHQADRLVGRVNTEIQTIDVKFLTPSPDGDDVMQVDASVFALHRESGRLARVDVANALLDDQVEFAERSDFHMARPPGDHEPVVTAVEPDGSIWVSTASGITSVRPEDDEPTHQASAGSVAVVDSGGVVQVYDPEEEAILRVGVDGLVGSMDIPVAIADPEITAVGAQVVLLDPAEGRIVLPDGLIVDLSDQGTEWALQQPGPAADRVLVATDRSLLAVTLTDGTVEAVHEGAQGPPAAPVRLGGCSYGAWNGGGASSLRACDGRDVEVTDTSIMRNLGAPKALVFRVNRDRVVLNDSATGTNLLFTDDEPKPVNWRDADSDEPDDEDQKEQIEQEEPECETTPRDPRVTEHVPPVGARAGRPVVVPVLDRISLDADPCDVLNVSVDDAFDESVALVEPVESGTALQITPLEGGGRASFDVPYELNGKTAATAAGTVRVVVHEDSANKSPVTVQDKTALYVGANRSEIRHNVLLTDSDPEGDPLTLVSAQADSDSSDVTVRYQPNGLVTVSAGSAATGTKRINYLVTDDRGAEPTEGELIVEVRSNAPNNPPKARPDRVSAVVGRQVTVDVLANDTDLDGDDLVLVGVDDAPEHLGVATVDGEAGVLSIEPTEAGGSPYFFDYEVTDGVEPAPVTGTVRVDVVADDGPNRAPVAVRDDLVARPGVPAMVDLVANDIDLDGDVLAVTSIEADVGDTDESGVEVELLEMRIARVTLPAGGDRSVTFRYSVTDGRDEATGLLVVRPLVVDDVNLPPITEDDEVTLRAGTVSSVAVLANDVDPEGEQLVLGLEVRHDEVQDPDGDVRGFVIHDRVHVVASAQASGTYRLRYDAVDPVPLTEEGTITVTVIGDDDNRPPRDPRITARIRAGGKERIALPLVGLDPDGDVVAVLGLMSPPRLGDVTFDDGVMHYEADRRAEGMDRFTIRLDDGRGGVTEGSVEVLVVPSSAGNAAPVAVMDEVTIGPGDTRVIEVLLNDTDPDGDDPVLQTSGLDAPTDPRWGSIKILDGDKVVYTQDRDLEGDPEEGIADTFTYGITDGRGGTDRGTVTVTITTEVANEPPVARDDLMMAHLPGDTVTVEPLANDHDPDGDRDALALRLDEEERERVAAETGARIRQVGDVIEVTVADEPRSVALPYTVVDPEDGEAEALIVIPVVEHLPPVAVTDRRPVDSGESVEIDVLANDLDPARGGALKVGLELIDVTNAVGGTWEPGEDGVVIFTATPDPDESGMGGFAYLIENEAELTAWGRAFVEITGQNFAPTLEDSEATVSAGGETVVDLDLLADDLNPSDVDRLEFSVDGATSAISATQSGSRGEVLTIAAADDALGETADLVVTVSDGDDDGQGAISVTVTAFEGERALAIDDVDRTHQEVAVDRDVTANDVRGAVGDLRIPDDVVLASSSGTVTVVDGDRRTLRFEPHAGFHGTANITYTIEDGTGELARRSTATWRVTVIGRPSAPSAPNGTAENRRVDLTWTAPSPNGADITGYIIEASPGPIRQESRGTSHSFTGLENDVAYTFRVLAVNEAVQTPEQQTYWSAPSRAFTPDVRPETPEPPGLTFGDRQITVRWTPPVTEGSAIRGYEVRLAGRGLSRPLGRDQTSFVWGDLTNGETYQFEVRAENNAGWSDWSRPSSATDINAVPAGTPSAPTEVRTELGDERFSTGGTMRVHWSWARPTHGNGAEVEQFTVTAVGEDGHRATYDQPGIRSPHLATGLRNGVSYTFEVVATTKAGDSLAGSSPPVTPSKPPNDIPASPLSGTDGDGRSVLTFSAPSANSTGPAHGGDPANFYYEVTTSTPVASGQPRWELRGSDPAQPHILNQAQSTVDRLRNGQTYAFTVRACTSERRCSASRTISNVRPYTNPTGPRNVRAVNARVRGGTAEWRWDAPSSDGGRPISHYEISVNGGGWTSVGRDLSHSRSINRGDTLTLRVRAINEGDAARRTGTASSNPGPSVYRLNPRVRISPGDIYTGDGRCPPTCRRVTVTLADVQSGSYAIDCFPNDPDYQHYTVFVSSDGSGHTSAHCAVQNTTFRIDVAGSSGSVSFTGITSVSGDGYDETRHF